jgi:hypothetical protein
MIIIGCDVHTRFQQIAMLDPTTGEIIERRLEHDSWRCGCTGGCVEQLSRKPSARMQGSPS